MKSSNAVLFACFLVTACGVGDRPPSELEMTEALNNYGARNGMENVTSVSNSNCAKISQQYKCTFTVNVKNGVKRNFDGEFAKGTQGWIFSRLEF